MTQYRIKTEQEFIDEFGKWWGAEVNWNLGGHMDYLFGQPVETNVKHRKDNWSINPLMITSLPLPTAEPKFGEWVDVKERLPEYGRWLVRFDTVIGANEECVADYQGVPRHCFENPPIDSTWYVYPSSGHVLRTVTHWMPLPAPPTKTNR